MEITNGEWKAEKPQGSNGYWEINAGDSRYEIATIWSRPKRNAQANAERIVKAVNSYDAMKKALNGLLEGSEIAPQQSEEPTRVWQRATPSEEAILAAFKALAKAE